MIRRISPAKPRTSCWPTTPSPPSARPSRKGASFSANCAKGRAEAHRGEQCLVETADFLKIEPLDEGRRTRFIQGERFTGLLVPLLRKNLERGTPEGFEAMNQFKARVEGSSEGKEPARWPSPRAKGSMRVPPTA